MILPSDVVSRMLVEVATGKPRTVQGPEARALYAELERECAELRAKGIDIEVPPEIPE